MMWSRRVIGSLVLVLAFVALSSSKAISNGAKVSWASEAEARLNDLQSRVNVSASLLNVIRSRVLYNGFFEGKVEKLRSLVTKSTQNQADALLKKHQHALDRMYRMLTAQSMSYEYGMGAIKALKEAERKANKYIKSLEMQTGSELVDKRALPSKVQQAPHFKALYGQLEKLHGRGQVPQAAFGISAKFRSDGHVSEARYHIGLQLPCACQGKPTHIVTEAARRVAAALNAPHVVERWIAHLEAVDTEVPSLGFGVDEEEGAAKVYMMTRTGENFLPDLPLQSGDKPVSLYQHIPETADRVPQMISLEWKFEQPDKVAIRHYRSDTSVSNAERIHKAALHSNLSPTSKSATEEPFLRFLEDVKGHTETVHSSGAFNPATSTPPPMRPSKLGFLARVPDAEFTDSIGSLLHSLNQDSQDVQSWIKSTSSALRHQISNVQTGQDKQGRWYVSLYRHPRGEMKPLSYEDLNPSNHPALRQTDGPVVASGACADAYKALQDGITGCEGQSSEWDNDPVRLFPPLNTCPSECAKLIQAVLDSCTGCGATAQINAVSCADCLIANADETGEGDSSADCTASEQRWAKQFTGADLASAVETWGPATCKMKHANAFNYMPTTAFCDDCKEYHSVYRDTNIWNYCGDSESLPSEPCYPLCKSAIVNMDSKCSEGDALCFENEPCCDGTNDWQKYKKDHSKTWQSETLWAGACGSMMDQVKVAVTSEYECGHCQNMLNMRKADKEEPESLCKDGGVIESTKVAGITHCQDASGTEIFATCSTSSNEKRIIDAAICRSWGGVVADSDIMTCTQIENYMFTARPELAHTSECEQQIELMKTLFAKSCCGSANSRTTPDVGDCSPSSSSMAGNSTNMTATTMASGTPAPTSCPAAGDPLKDYWAANPDPCDRSKCMENDASDDDCCGIEGTVGCATGYTLQPLSPGLFTEPDSFEAKLFATISRGGCIWNVGTCCMPDAPEAPAAPETPESGKTAVSFVSKLSGITADDYSGTLKTEFETAILRAMELLKEDDTTPMDGTTITSSATASARRQSSVDVASTVITDNSNKGKASGVTHAKLVTAMGGQSALSSVKVESVSKVSVTSTDSSGSAPTARSWTVVVALAVALLSFTGGSVSV